MRRGLLIMGGLLIIILIALWVYILFFSDNASGPGRFSDLLFGDTTDQTIPADQLTGTSSEPMVDTSNTGPLRQLTTRPVVGYREVNQSASTSPLIYFVESGTGHIYTINLTTGEENRVSNITVPNVTKAVVSHSGTFVVLQSPNAVSIIGLSSMVDARPSSFTLEETVLDIAVTDTDTLLYAVNDTAGVTVKSFDLLNKTVGSTLFFVPFREVTIEWGESVAGPHYYYPKPSSKLLGYLYVVKDGATARTPVSGFGLQAKQAGRYVLFSTTGNSVSVYDNGSEIVSPLYLDKSVTKCFGVWTTGLFFCGMQSGKEAPDLEEWYAGAIHANDDLFKVNAETLETSLVSTLSSEQRPIDMLGPIHANDSLLFKDKKTGFLWIYMGQNRNR
jgi:hypothetical protein